MNDQDFEARAIKVLAKEASAEEVELLHSVIAQSETRRKEFEELKETLGILCGAGSLVKALDAKDAALPAYRLGQLKTALQYEFGRQRAKGSSELGASGSGLPWFRWNRIFATGMAVMVLICLFLFLPQKREDIEIGLYENSLMRGSENSFETIQKQYTKTVVFKNENEFEKWRNKPFLQNQKAKIWIEEETETVFVLYLDANGNLKQSSAKLLKNSTPKQQIEKIIQALP